MPTNYDKDKTRAPSSPGTACSRRTDRGTPIFKTGLTRLYNRHARRRARASVATISPRRYENDYGIEPNNSLRQVSVHANVDVAVNANDRFLRRASTSSNLSEHLGADIGLSAMFGADFGHPLLWTAPAGRGILSRTFRPKCRSSCMTTLMASIASRRAERSTIASRVGSRSARSSGSTTPVRTRERIEHFAPPELAALLSAAHAGGSIGQTLRHNSIITADYSGTAKFNLTPSLGSSSSVGGQFYNTELNTSVLGGDRIPGAGRRDGDRDRRRTAVRTTQTINTTIGAYGQQQFGWHDRFFLSAGLRVDNNSAFGDKLQWVTYPKVSASWVVERRAVLALERQDQHAAASRRVRRVGPSARAFSALRTFTHDAGPGRRDHRHAGHRRQRGASPGAWQRDGARLRGRSVQASHARASPTSTSARSTRSSARPSRRRPDSPAPSS